MSAEFMDRQPLRLAGQPSPDPALPRVVGLPVPAAPWLTVVDRSPLADAKPFNEVYPALRAGSYRDVDVPGGGAA